jgi:Flp pilus assembly protein TadG
MTSVLHRFAQDRKGTTLLLFGLLAPVLIFAIGLSVDYSLAAARKSRVDAAADAAALMAVTPAMMKQSTATATTAAQNAFAGQVSGISGVSYSPSNLTVTVTTSGGTRTVKVTYTATSANNFGGFLGQTNWTIGGTSTSSATQAPNIDFYLLLDNSPSMAIAATTAGINTMVANTASQGGCAFACHQTNPGADSLGNPGGVDNYQLAKNLGVTTRIDNLRSATQSLMDTATASQTANGNTYRMGIYTFAEAGAVTIASLTSSLSSAKTLAGNIDVLTVYKNNWLTSSNKNNDTDTDFEQAMSDITAIMPTPGTGYTGSTPQEVLFLVSDGVDDKMSGGSRFEGLFDTSYCTTVKNKGIMVAVLYTEYLPLPTNAWYNAHVAPFQSQIAGNMQSCATPGLFFQVTTDSDITAAMAALFQAAITTAHLVK